MTTRTLAVVSAGLSTPSSSRLLADRLTEATVAALRTAEVETTVEVVELRDHARGLADHLLTGFPDAELRQAIDTVSGADAVIAVTAIFAASYSGLFKLFADVLDPYALQGTPVLLGATAGSARHSLALDHALRPLFSYLHATVVPTAVFAAAEDWAAGGVDALSGRIDRAGAELAALVVGRPAETRVTAALPSFEDLLRRPHAR